MKKIPQWERIVKYMNDFGSITTRDAFNDLGCSRLSGRIYDIKKKGYEIETETERGTNRYGEPCHYARYSLKED